MATWIEVALNGPWGRVRQPRCPISVQELVQEGVAATKAGASIIHVHAYDPHTGRQNDDADTYARVIEGIRNEVDAIVYPTLPLAGSTLTGSAASTAARFAHVVFLAERNLLEMSVVDPGSVNFITKHNASESSEAFVYQNPLEDIEEGLSLCAAYRIRPSFAIYEPGFARTGAYLSNLHKDLQTPLYRFMFTDQFLWGFPPDKRSLSAYIDLLEAVSEGAPWMIAGLGVDLRHLIAEAVPKGGHVRVGLEDAPFGTQRSNIELVEEAVRLVRQAGGEPATAARVREELSACDSKKRIKAIVTG